MARKHPGLKLRVSVARAVGALRAGLSPLVNEDPQCPDELLDLDDALESFEQCVYDQNNTPLRERCIRVPKILFDETDLI